MEFELYLFELYMNMTKQTIELVQYDNNIWIRYKSLYTMNVNIWMMGGSNRYDMHMRGNGRGLQQYETIREGEN